MSWTKRQIIGQAFNSLGMPVHVFELEPEQILSAALELDAMVAEWPVRIGWPAPASPDETALDTGTGVADWCVSALYLGLAVRLAPSYGKEVSPMLRSAAVTAMDRMLARLGNPPPRRELPSTTPAGAGWKRWRYGYGFPFTPPPADPLLAGADQRIDGVGDDQ